MIDSMIQGDEVDFLNYYKGSLYGALRRSVDSHPELMALDFLGEKFTYRKLHQRVVACASAFRDLGINEGDRIAIMLPNCPQAVIAFYAASMIGAIAVMIHPLISEKELQHCIELTESSLLLAMDTDYVKAATAASKIEDEDGTACLLIVTSLLDELSSSARLAFCAEAKSNDLSSLKIAKEDSACIWANVLSASKMQSVVVEAEETRFDEGDLTDKPAAILFSGGTTGNLKGVLLSNGNINASYAQFYSAAGNGMHPGERMLVALPLFHGFGLSACLHTGLVHGMCCLLIPRLTPEEYTKVMTVGRCNYIFGVPTLIDKLLSSISSRGMDLSFVKEVVVGGDVLPDEMRMRLDQLLEEHGSIARVRVGYGSTELVAPFCIEPHQNSKAGSIGKIYLGNRCKIVDPQTGNELPICNNGELLASSPTIMMGYWKNPEETAKAITVDKEGVRWLHTGDVASIDEDGFLFYRGRLKRMIVSNGYNVFPSIIEDVLNKSPLVKTSCVVGIPDQVCLHRVKAFVVLNNGVCADDDTRKQLMGLLCDNVARYALPKEIEFRDVLPVTKVGKIDYRALQREGERHIKETRDDA